MSGRTGETQSCLHKAWFYTSIDVWVEEMLTRSLRPALGGPLTCLLQIMHLHTVTMYKPVKAVQPTDHTASNMQLLVLIACPCA